MLTAINDINGVAAVLGAIFALIACVNSAVKLGRGSQDVVGDVVTMLGGLVGAVVLLKFIYLRLRNMSNSQNLNELKEICTTTARSLKNLIARFDERDRKMDERDRKMDERDRKMDEFIRQSNDKFDSLLQDIKDIKLNKI